MWRGFGAKIRARLANSMFESGVGNTLPSLELVSKLASEKGTVPNGT
jgi:hypothetical protein